MTRPSTSSPALGAVMENAASSRLYAANAFRVLGLRVDASVREISRHAERLAVQMKFGEREAARWHSFLGEVDPTEMSASTELLSDPERRLLEEVFWFWPIDDDGSTDAGLKALERGEIGRALEFWGKTECEAAAHNLAVYNHAVAVSLDERTASGPLSAAEVARRDTAWESALAWWVAVLDGGVLEQRLSVRAAQLDDPRATHSLAKSVAGAFERIIVTAAVAPAVAAARRGDAAAVARHMGIVRASGLDDELVSETVQSCTLPSWSRVGELCETAGRTDEESQGLKAAKLLLKEARPLLELIDAFFDSSDLVRSDAHDEVASAAAGCLIMYANATKDWRGIQTLFGSLPAIASGTDLKRRLKDNLETLRENVAGAGSNKPNRPVSGAVPSCWFCDARLGRGGEPLHVLLHGNVQVKQQGNMQRTTWDKSEVSVPRCRECASAHALERDYIRNGRIVGVVLGVAAAFCLLFAVPWILVPVEFFVFGYAGIAVGRSLARRLWPTGIQPELHYVKFGPLDEQLKAGWSLGPGPGEGESPASGDGPFAWLSAYPKPVAIVATIIALLGLVPLMGEQAKQDLWGIRSAGVASVPAKLSSETPAIVTKPSEPTAKKASSAASASPATPTASTPAVPTYSSSTVDSGEVSRLRTRVDSERRRLRTEADQLEALGANLDNLKNQIAAIKSTLQRYERGIDAGLDVDRYGYNRDLDRHNSLVERHNQLLGQYRSLQATHNQSVAAFNAEVDELNRLTGR